MSEKAEVNKPLNEAPKLKSKCLFGAVSPQQALVQEEIKFENEQLELRNEQQEDVFEKVDQLY